MSKTSRSARVAAAAVAALAAVTVSGCGPSRHGDEAKPWPTAVPSPIAAQVTETGGDAATATAKAPESPWTTVSQPTPDRDHTGGRIGTAPYTGIALGQHQLNGRTEDCTAGAAVTDGSRIGFVVAGHCDKNKAGHDDGVFIFTDQAGNPVRIGEFELAKDTGIEDFGIVWPSIPPRDAGRIAGLPVVGVMSPAAVRALPKGTPVCLSGGWAGVRCTTLDSATDLIRYPHVTEGGDSGAAVFLVDHRQRATLIGIHQGPAGATYLTPALDQLGVTAVTAAS